MREGVAEPGGCHGGTSLRVNAGIRSQAPEKSRPRENIRQMQSTRCVLGSSAAASPLQPPVNYNFEE